MNFCWLASRGRAWREVPRTLRLGAALVEALRLYPSLGGDPALWLRAHRSRTLGKGVHAFPGLLLVP